MKKSVTRYGICLKNQDCDDLLLGKVYTILPDKTAEKSDLVRVTDESGEDYLYPSSYFFVISLPLQVRRALSKVNKKSVA